MLTEARRFGLGAPPPPPHSCRHLGNTLRGSETIKGHRAAGVLDRFLMLNAIADSRGGDRQAVSL